MGWISTKKRIANQDHVISRGEVRHIDHEQLRELVSDARRQKVAEKEIDSLEIRMFTKEDK